MDKKAKILPTTKLLEVLKYISLHADFSCQKPSIIVQPVCCLIIVQQKGKRGYFLLIPV